MIAILIRRIGPYHHARLCAATKRMAVTAVEIFAADDTYAWEPVEWKGPFERMDLFRDPELLSQPARIHQTVWGALDQLQPEAVAIPGWYEGAGLASLAWCVEHGVPAVVMSETARHDARRLWWKEWIKRRVVGLCSAGLVGGVRHAEYLQRLGMPRERIYDGYDVVDNAHFEKGAEVARRNGDQWRERLGLPSAYFLACNRFLARKNLLRLLRAYASYRARAVDDAWKLVLLGDGEFKPELLREIDELGLAGEVQLPGFIQYGQLPVYYGLARAFVHASVTEGWGLVVNEAMAAGLPVLVSERCGCAPELVQNGRNGFTFNPFDVEELAGHLFRLASLPSERAEMGRESRRIISGWSPDRFAESLAAAVTAGGAAPRARATAIDRFLLRKLSRR